jgi:hypothetical protein
MRSRRKGGKKDLLFLKKKKQKGFSPEFLAWAVPQALPNG